MEPLPQQSKILLVLTATLLLGSSWLAAVLLEPRLPNVANIASQVLWRDAGALLEWHEVARSKAIDLAQVAGNLNRISSRFALLGPFQHPPILLIDETRTEAAVVNEDRIHIALSEAKNPRALAPCLMKAWLLQWGGSAVTASRLRLNVAAEALAEMLLGVQDDSHAPTTNWLSVARSYKALCQQTACSQSTQISPLSFQTLLVALLLEKLNQVPRLERDSRLANWSRELLALEDQDPRQASRFAELKTLNEWREWLHGEALFFKIEEFRLGRVRLGRGDAPELDLGVQAPEDIGVGLQLKDDEVLLNPGDVHLPRTSIDDLHIKFLVIQECRTQALLKRVGDIVDGKISVGRVLYISECGKIKNSTWLELVHAKPHQLSESFAGAEPRAPFITLDLEMLRLAIKRKQLSRELSLNELLTQMASDRPQLKSIAPLLGLESPQFHKEVAAYRVLGAIEAIEWYRVGPVAQ